MDSLRARQAEVLRRVLESDRIDLHTALPGVIRSYDDNTQTADIALGVKRVLPSADDDDADEVEDYPILPSVPVLWPRGSGGYLHIPLSAGDGVLVVFAESDISRWRETGEAGEDPGVATRHGLSGAVAFAGLHWRGNPNPDAAKNPEESASLRLGIEGGARIEILRVFAQYQIRAGGTSRLAKSDPVQAQLDALAADLALVNAAIATAGPSSVGVPVASPNAGYDAAKAANPIQTSTLRGD